MLPIALSGMSRTKIEMLQKFLDHKKMYFWLMILMAIALPVSKFLMTFCVVSLLINWVLELDFKVKWKRIKERKALWLILSLYFLHILGLLWTSDFHYGLADLQKKLPLFILPLVIGTSDSLSARQIRYVLWFFTTTVIVNSVISVTAYFGVFNEPLSDPREMSLFFSHIRFSLLINVAIFFSGYYFYAIPKRLKKYEKISFALGIIWLIPFLMFLRSFTGIILFALTFFFISIYWAWIQKNLIIKILVPLLLVVVVIIGAKFVSNEISSFYKTKQYDFAKLDKVTAKGNKYKHDTTNTQLENGDYIWLYVCEKELKEEWNTRSKISYDQKDRKGNVIKYTLIRYLTSKGLRKDAEGIAQLSDRDIELIEMGYANHVFEGRFSIRPKIYELIWQIDRYKKGGNPSGHSVTQRIEYLKGALYIIKNNFWTGVGTGDVQQAFDNYYDITNSQLSKKWRRRAHNQYLTFFLTFGVFGFVWFIITLFAPPLLEHKYKQFFFVLLIFISAISMLNEDTLENHAGICFFSFFYSLFLFARIEKKV